MLMLLLVGGAIVNVAVAWGCVTLDVSRGEFLLGRIEKPDGAWWVAIRRRSGAQLVRSTAEANPVIVEAVDFLAEVPHWSRVHGQWDGPLSTSEEFGDYEFDDARGWPVLSLRSSFDLDSFEFKQELEQQAGTAATDERITSPEFIQRTGVNLATGDCTRNGILVREPSLSGEDFRCLPLRPIWPGFAINTVFYAALLWLLFAGPFALRRWRRIKRGLCPKCGYDLRGGRGSGGVGRPESAACPECGAQRASE